jgi:hypothetical protein
MFVAGGGEKRNPRMEFAIDFLAAREPFEQCNSVNIAAQTFSTLTALY